MRILISYFFDANYIPVGYSLADGFIANGWDVVCFNCLAEHPLWRYGVKPLRGLVKAVGLWEASTNSCVGHVGYKRDRFFRAIIESRPDVVLVIKAHDFLFPRDIEDIKRNFGVKVVAGWSVDGPNVKCDLGGEADAYDLYYSIHEAGCRSMRVRRLPLAAMDPARYFRSNTRFTARTERAVLVSGWNPRRDSWVEALIRARVSVYGDWRKAAARNEAIRAQMHRAGAWGTQLRELYNRTRIGLSIQGWDPALDPCCNLRVMDIPACGALLLAEHHGELTENFRMGVEAESFVNGDEMADKIAYYDSHWIKAARIARRGHEKALRLPTYTDKARKIIEDINELLP